MLNSCLDQMRSVLGDFNTEHVLIDAAIEAGFDSEKALNLVLNSAGDILGECVMSDNKWLNYLKLSNDCLL